MKQSPRRQVLILSFLGQMACLYMAIVPASCQAKLLYDFVEDSTGDILATMELFQIPATVNDFMELTFSPTGDAKFGFGPQYLGAFDSSLGPGSAVISDGVGGLVGDGGFVSWIDDDPPPSDLGLTSSFSVEFHTIDFIPKVKLEVVVAESVPIAVEGHWLAAVPEPASSVLLIGSVVATVCFYRCGLRK